MHPRQQSRAHWQRPVSRYPQGDTRPVATRMAEVMRDQNAEGGCDRQSLLRAGFTNAEINDHHKDAEVRATRLFMGEPEPLAIDDDALAAERIRADITELFPPMQFIVMDMLARGHSKAHLDRHLAKQFRLALQDAADKVQVQ